MAQVNITLSQEEVLQVLAGNRNEAFKYLVERILNQIMLVESAEQLGAERHERTEERHDYRNGTRARTLNTRIGTLDLEVPRHRNEPFHTLIFDNYQRSEAALIATMVQTSKDIKVFATTFFALLTSSGKPMTERMDVSLRVIMNWLIMLGIIVLIA